MQKNSRLQYLLMLLWVLLFIFFKERPDSQAAKNEHLCQVVDPPILVIFRLKSAIKTTQNRTKSLIFAKSGTADPAVPAVEWRTALVYRAFLP